MSTVAEAPSPTEEERSEAEQLTYLQQSVSASRLTLYLQCRLKFHFRYVLRLKKPKSPALQVGNAVHSTLSRWNKARWRSQPLSLKQVHQTYEEAWADHLLAEPVHWDGDEEAEKMTGWRLVETYLRESNLDPATKPDAVEVPVDAELVNHGLPRLIGILDLVQDGRIIDYKTSSTTPNPEKVAHNIEIQSSTYAELYRHATGKREAGIEVHHLVKLKNPKLVITPLPPMSPQQQTRLFHLMEAYVEGLSRRDFIPSPGMQCTGCEFFNECRAWH